MEQGRFELEKVIYQHNFPVVFKSMLCLREKKT